MIIALDFESNLFETLSFSICCDAIDPIPITPISSESCQKNTKSSRAHQVSCFRWVSDEKSLPVIDWAIFSIHQLQNLRAYSGEKLMECISTS